MQIFGKFISHVNRESGTNRAREVFYRLGDSTESITMIIFSTTVVEFIHVFLYL